MKPPFWEVTISRQVLASQPPVIESVNCFGNESDAERYRKHALEADPSVLVIIRLVNPPPSNGGVVTQFSSIISCAGNRRSQGGLGNSG